jgi:pSer/pThr/pTyr-binding forkhead associated (FHA) protein
MKVRLRVVRGKPQGKCFSFPPGEFVIGRGSECHLRPNSSWVSRQHCMLRVTDVGASLRDLGSVNGTLVNGRRLVGEHPLAHGDQVQVGPLVFEVCLEPPPAGPGREAETASHCLETSESQVLKAKAATPAPEVPTSAPRKP